MGVTIRDSSTATLGAASTTLLAASASRTFLLIENTHATNDIWVNPTGGTAAANGSGCIFLPHGGGANARIVFAAGVNQGCPSNAITAISTGANTTVTVLDNGVA